MKRVCKIHKLIGGISAYHVTMDGRTCLIQDMEAYNKTFKRLVKHRCFISAVSPIINGVPQSITVHQVYRYGQCVLLDDGSDHCLFVWRNPKEQSIAVIELMDIPTSSNETQFLGRISDSTPTNHHTIDKFLLYLYTNTIPKPSVNLSTYRQWFESYCEAWGIEYPIALYLLPFTEINGLSARDCSVFNDLDIWMQLHMSIWDIFLS